MANLAQPSGFIYRTIWVKVQTKKQWTFLPNFSCLGFTRLHWRKFEYRKMVFSAKLVIRRFRNADATLTPPSGFIYDAN